MIHVENLAENRHTYTVCLCVGLYMCARFNIGRFPVFTQPRPAQTAFRLPKVAAYDNIIYSDSNEQA